MFAIIIFTVGWAFIAWPNGEAACVLAAFRLLPAPLTPSPSQAPKMQHPYSYIYGQLR